MTDMKSGSHVKTLLDLQPSSLYEMKLIDLKDICKKFDLCGYKSKTKAKIILMILNARNREENELELTLPARPGTPRKISFPRRKSKLQETHFICTSNPPVRHLSCPNTCSVDDEKIVYVDKRSKLTIDQAKLLEEDDLDELSEFEDEVEVLYSEEHENSPAPSPRKAHQHPQNRHGPGYQHPQNKHAVGYQCPQPAPAARRDLKGGHRAKPEPLTTEMEKDTPVSSESEDTPGPSPESMNEKLNEKKASRAARRKRNKKNRQRAAEEGGVARNLFPVA